MNPGIFKIFHYVAMYITLELAHSCINFSYICSYIAELNNKQMH